MIRINENLMGESTIAWVEHTASSNYFLFGAYYYPLAKLPASGIISISADIEFITPDPENISAVARVKDFAESDWRFIRAKDAPYTAGHRVKFEALNVGQYYSVGVGIYVGEDYKTKGNIGRIRKIKVEDGSECTMWIPPESTLTPEQIAMMKYGEFTEARQI